MTRTTSSLASGLTRRTAIGGLGVAAFLSVHPQPSTAAQAEELVDHPLTGTWLAMANPPLPEDPPFPAPSLFAADGTVLLQFPATARGPQGPVFQSPYVGTWGADSDRRGHFTAVQQLSASDGTFLGTITVDGFPEVSGDGQTFIDDGSRVTVTMRDATGAITEQFLPTGKPDGRPVTGIKMGVGISGFPDMSEATPTNS